MPLSDDDAIDLLKRGAIELEGRLVDASNTTLRAIVNGNGVQARCVYKPIAGEAPLWDFPHGTLAGRELAAYLVSQATGWNVVPPTVLRDGPLGAGMVQLWIDEERQADDDLLGFVPVRRVPEGWHRVVSARDDRGRPYVLAHTDDPRLARMAVFDAVANNAARKLTRVTSQSSGTLSRAAAAKETVFSRPRKSIENPSASTARLNSNPMIARLLVSNAAWSR